MTITISGSGNPLDVDGTNTGFYPTLMTAQATTSGTVAEFTSIPSWVKKITVIINGVRYVASTNVDYLLIQLGTSSSYETTGYSGSTAFTFNSLNPTVGSFTTGISLTALNNANSAHIYHGSVTIIRANGDTWVASGAGSLSNSAIAFTLGSSKTLSGALTRVRLIGTNTNAFNLGQVNVLYE